MPAADLVGLFVRPLNRLGVPYMVTGAVAATLLIDALEGRGDPFARVVVPTRLIVRGSTAPAFRRKRRRLPRPAML